MSNQPSYRLLSNISFNSKSPYSRTIGGISAKTKTCLSREGKSKNSQIFLFSPFDLSFEPESLQVF